MNYKTIKVKFQESICFIQLYRPEANNTINKCMIEELTEVLEQCEKDISIIVLEGLPEIFCFGADFKEIHHEMDSGILREQNPESLYDLWLKLTTGPYITIAHVRGRANAGGVGFAAACNIVIADKSGSFSLSELLFGLLPACVFPFLICNIIIDKHLS